MSLKRKNYSLAWSLGRDPWRPIRAQGKFRTTGACWIWTQRNTCCYYSCLGNWGGKRNMASPSCTVSHQSSCPWKRKGPRNVGSGDRGDRTTLTSFQISAAPLTAHASLGKSSLQASVSSTVRPRDDFPPAQGCGENEITEPRAHAPSTMPSK